MTIEIISFPKCGRTWLKCILGCVLASRKNINSQNLSLKTLDPSLYTDDVFRLRHDLSRDLQHPFLEHYKTIKNHTIKTSKHKSIFLTRNPLDVIVSVYFERKYRYIFWGRRFKYNKTISEFIREDTGSLKTLREYLKKVNLFASHKNSVIVKYENLHTRQEKEVNKILEDMNENDL